MLAFAVLALFATTVPNAVVQHPVVNMYSRPSEDAGVVSQAIFGANVAVVEQKDGWARIRTADEYLGWTPIKSLAIGTQYGSHGKVAQVESLFAHIYREPSVTKHAPLLTVPFESRLEVTGEAMDEGRWLPVRLPDDRTGWVQAGDVTFAPKTMTIAGTLEFAKRFLGLPYTWGGTSSYGYDCSGFSQMLGRRRGINMPRDSPVQAEWNGVVAVPRDALEPGDLLFFGDSEKKITHTGIYLGGGKFISATTHIAPMVRIDDLSDPHWTKLFVAARRVK